MWTVITAHPIAASTERMALVARSVPFFLPALSLARGLLIANSMPSPISLLAIS